VLAGKPEPIRRAQHGRHERGIDPAGIQVFRIDGQARCELEPPRLGRLAQPLDGRPGRLGVDVVDRDRRDPAPVVDPSVEKERKVVVGQVRRRLDVQLRAEHDPRRGGRPEQLLQARLGVPGHPRARLGPEVLDDHLLHVAVPLVQVADREQRLDPLGTRLADPDQDPGRERDRELSGEPQRLQTYGRPLVGRAEVRAAALREPVRDGLEHDPLRDAHLA
jgi:hypothetical protein